MTNFALAVKFYFGPQEFEHFCERASIKADSMVAELAELEAYEELRARRPFVRRPAALREAVPR